ncbi:hypothetical protein MKEN_00835700 [Mycena kentingensis (nom. inval.)]|nr:hypothetical protein MKEN_00835700 [Mycena kentingensis (nom. inval.)]
MVQLASAHHIQTPHLCCTIVAPTSPFKNVVRPSTPTFGLREAVEEKGEMVLWGRTTGFIGCPRTPDRRRATIPNHLPRPSTPFKRVKRDTKTDSAIAYSRSRSARLSSSTNATSSLPRRARCLGFGMVWRFAMPAYCRAQPRHVYVGNSGLHDCRGRRLVRRNYSYKVQQRALSIAANVDLGLEPQQSEEGGAAGAGQGGAVCSRNAAARGGNASAGGGSGWAEPQQPRLQGVLWRVQRWEAGAWATQRWAADGSIGGRDGGRRERAGPRERSGGRRAAGGVWRAVGPSGERRGRVAGWEMYFDGIT